jgi:hypothetical protein
VLKAGEIAIAYLGETVSDKIKGENRPVLFKVGDGVTTFANLPWASALAADVYDWAKKSEEEFIAWVNEQIEHPVESNDYGKVTADEGSIEADAIHDTFAIKGEGVVSTKAANDTVTISVDLSEYAKTADLPEIPDVTASGDDEVILSAEGHHVSGSHATHAAGSAKTASTATISGYSATGAIKIPKIVTNAAGHITEISEETVSIAIPAAIIDTNTAHTHTAGDGLKLSGDGGINGIVDYSLNLALKLKDGNIILHDKDDAKKVIATLDAAELLEDSYLNDVDIVGNELQFTWKMDDGSTKTDSVDLTHLVDVYTGENEGTVKVEVDNYKISAEVIDGTLKDVHIADDAAIAETKLAQDVQDALALARTAKQKQTAVDNQIADAAHVLSYLAQDENGDISYEVKMLTPGDIGAQPSGNYKTKQTAVSEAGSTTKTITAISQNENGVIDVTYSDIAFPDIAAKGVTTEKIDDHAVGAHQTKACQDYTGDDAEVWVFCCGSASTLI